MPVRTQRVSSVNKNDGHIYYVVNGDSGRIHVGIVFLNYYNDLHDFDGSEGLYLVRNAAGVYEDNPDDTRKEVVPGDPTVHEGWALYCWDNNKEGPHKGGWRKVAEQESVDGPWGIDERILKMLVKKTEFNAVVGGLERRIINNENNIQTIQANIVNVNNAIVALNELKHGHGNKQTLDGLSDKGGQLAYNGRIITGNTFLYDNAVDGVLYWVDPTYVPPPVEDDEEPVPFEPVACLSSAELAYKFAQTSLATPGLILEVIEVDGSISRYDIVKNAEDEDVAVFHDATTAKSIGINYVVTLPAEGHQYNDRGVWCPLMDDGVYTPKTFYISKYGRWVPLDAEYGAGTQIGMVGAEVTLAYCKADPGVPFKKNNLTWREPSTAWQDPATLLTYSWGKTSLVRKYGSVPTSISDGTVVMVNTTSGVVTFEDVCPYNDEPVYYQLFSETKGGARCTCSKSEGIQPKCLTWTSILNHLRNFNNENPRLINVKDDIVLPEHPVYGKIQCEVIGVTTDGTFIVASKDVLGIGSLSGFSSWISKNFTDYTKYVKSDDHVVDGSKEYKIFDETNGFIDCPFAVGEEIPEEVTLYERNAETPNGIVVHTEMPSYLTIGGDNISRDKHYKHQIATTEWWFEESPDDGTEKGYVVIFEIGNVA